MNDLQLFAKCYVEVHDLDSKTKDELFEFIDNGSDAEVINLIETGNMEHLTPLEEKQILESVDLNEDFGSTVAQAFLSLARTVSGKKPTLTLGKYELWLNQSDYETILKTARNLVMDAAAVGAVATTAVVAITLFLAAKYLKERLSQAGKACKGKKGKEFKKCIAQYKLDAYKGQIKVLQDGLKNCSKTKNPQKCTKKLQDKITKIKQKMAKLSKDIQKYK